MSISPRSPFFVFIVSLVSGLSFGLIIYWLQSNTYSTGFSDAPYSFSCPDSTDNRKVQDSLFHIYLKNGEDLLVQKNLNQAVVAFEKAQKIRPNDTRLKERVTGLKAQLSEQNRKINEYQKALTSGDTYFNARDYLNAKASYQVAIDNRPDDTLAKGKLRKTMDLLRSQKAQNILYDVAMASADKLFQAKDYDRARVEFENASKILPQEQYPRDKINEIIKIQIDKQVNDELYAKAISNGDKFFSMKSYQSSLLEFQKAQGIRPEEPYPKQKIAELTMLITAQKTRDEAYNIAILQADQLFQLKKYTESVKGYQQALTIKPDEVYPKNRIREIENLLASRKKEQEEYDRYITLADSLYIEKSYLRARENYGLASSVKPSEAYPKEMITKTDKMLTGQQAAMVQVTAMDEQYRLTIANADKMLGQKNYDPAKTEYQKAAGYKPAETYPKIKITEIDSILNDLLQAKSREEQYKSLLVSADKELAVLAYEQAKTDYQKALALKPAEYYPKSKIAEIDRILLGITQQKVVDEKYKLIIYNADSLLAVKAYEQARTDYQNALKIKPTEVYPKDRLTEIAQILALIAKEKTLRDQYAALITQGESQMQIKQYSLSRTSFEQALSLKPEEKLPKEKIAAIDSILAELAKQKALDDQYKSVVANADKLLASKMMEQARSEYVNAGNLKPAEQYPRDKIAEIDKMLGDLAAKKALDEQYTKTITDADKLFAEKSYDQAKALYVNTGSLKPAEVYPRNRIAEIDRILAEIAKQKALDEQYAATIVNADKLLSEKSYEPAKVEYQKAGGLKPAEQYPKTKVAEIDKEFAKQKAIDDQYQSIVARADQLLALKSYDQAKTEYVNAGKVKPAEQYPKDKIIEIDGILSEIKAKEEAYNASVLKGDQLLAEKKYDESSNEFQNALIIKPEAKYPADKISEINRILTELKGKRQTYEELIVRGDGQFTMKEWMKAKGLYQQALSIFPEETYPKEKIGMIGFKIDSIYRANKDRYDNAVAEGDRYYNSFEYDKAIDSYMVAYELLPMENYPREMISKIRRTIAENAIVDILKTPVTIAAGEEKQFTFTPVNMASRKNNFVYIKIRNLSSKSFNILMRYGQDKQPGGGVVIRNLSADGKVNERLVSVRDQDAWYRFDNNWISLYPQGGDVEVTFIQVSRAQNNN